MLKSNYFEQLRHPGIEDATDIRQYPIKELSVFDNRIEQIVILTADINGKIAAGFNIRFSEGREAYQLPALVHGWFDSERNAILYYLGYFKTYCNYFTPEAIDVINRLIPQYSQQNLF